MTWSEKPLVALVIAFTGAVVTVTSLGMALHSGGLALIRSAAGIESSPKHEAVITPLSDAGVSSDSKKPPIKSVRLWSNGDSTSFFMSVELRDQIAARGATLAQSEAEYQNGTGLITSEYFDWPAYLKTEMEQKRPDLVVFMIGANDAKFIGDPEEYRALVAEAMDLLRAPGRRVIWVGQPNSNQAKLAQNLPTVNAIFEEEASKRPWVTYVDTWAATSDQSGNYSQVLADGTGQLVQARAGDGVHFTQDGGRILADVVMEAVLSLYGE